MGAVGRTHGENAQAGPVSKLWTMGNLGQEARGPTRQEGTVDMLTEYKHACDWEAEAERLRAELDLTNTALSAAHGTLADNMPRIGQLEEAARQDAKTIANLRAALAEAREVIVPFANAAMAAPPGAEDSSFASAHGVGLNLGHLRRARAVLEKTGGEGE